MDEYKCVVCAKVFAQNSDRQIYCGVACADIERAKQQAKRDEERKQLVSGQPIGQCQRCGREFGRNRNRVTYCSSDCAKGSQPSGKRKLTTMAEIVAHNATLPPLEGCHRCKRRTGHDDWCPIGGSDAN